MKEGYRESEEAAIELINRNVETANWVAQEELHDYQEYSRAHPVAKVQMLMVDPRIVEIIEELRPSSQ